MGFEDKVKYKSMPVDMNKYPEQLFNVKNKVSKLLDHVQDLVSYLHT